jgi:FlaA1/EpsC-like NDP-sugar epimerase
MTHSLDGANVVILGGTGSLGQRLAARILDGSQCMPASVTIFSRDEAKQHYMRLAFQNKPTATDDIIYSDSKKRLHFVIGDVRNYADMKRSVDRADVIFHAAALKQVPTCEYFGGAAVDTNVYGAINLARAISEGSASEKTIVGISTDKACKPVNLMGMTKAVQERILIQANLHCDKARFVNVRYGNVMASRGSAIPYFIDLVRRKRPITITDDRMTRFLMTIDQSVDLIFAAFRHGLRGETLLPLVPAAKVTDIARAVAGDTSYPLEVTGIRPGEKLHEILVSEEEVSRTQLRDGNLVIAPVLPELRHGTSSATPLPFKDEYSSRDGNLSYNEVVDLLTLNELTAANAPHSEEIYR